MACGCRIVISKILKLLATNGRTIREQVWAFIMKSQLPFLLKGTSNRNMQTRGSGDECCHFG